MALVPWTITPIRGGGWLATVTFTGASQNTDLLETHDRPVKTVDIFGTFGGSNVSLLGLNNTDTATAKAIHRSNDGSATFSAIAAGLLASIVENPRYLFAQSNGAVTSVTITVVMVDVKSK